MSIPRHGLRHIPCTGQVVWRMDGQPDQTLPVAGVIFDGAGLAVALMIVPAGVDRREIAATGEWIGDAAPTIKELQARIDEHEHGI